MVLGVLIPLTMLADPELSKGLPSNAPVLWLITSVAGFVVPCFLVRFRLYKTAAILTSAGAASLFAVRALLQNAIAGFGWFYLPLLTETVAVILIAVLVWRVKQNERDNAPAPSVIDN